MNDGQWSRTCFELEQLRKEFFVYREMVFNLGLASNITTSERWINGMVFLLMIALALKTSPFYFYGAIFPIASVMAAWLGDQLQWDWMGKLSVLLAVLPVLLFLINDPSL